MSGAKLHAFDLALCGYAVGTIQGCMHGDNKFTDVVRSARKLRELWNFVRLPIEDPDCDPEGLLLNDAEFYSLIDFFESRPIESDRPWIASPDLHRRYVHTLVEVRKYLAPATAQQWAETCTSYSKKLDRDRVRLAEGLAFVHDWVQDLRQLLRAMEADRYLPRPQGLMPTPSTGCTTPPSVKPTVREQQAIERMREAIRSLGRDCKPDTLIGWAKVQNKRARDALRWLENAGEYGGFTRKAKRES